MGERLVSVRPAVLSQTRESPSPSPTGETLRAISMWQPIPSLLAAGVLSIETRSWKTAPGPIALHAGKSRKGFEWATYPLWREVMNELGLRVENLPLGCVVAVCDIVEVVRTDELELPPDSLDAAMLALPPGHWAFRLANMRPLPRPVPCPGGRMVFRLPSEAHAQVMAQLG